MGICLEKTLFINRQLISAAKWEVGLGKWIAARNDGGALLSAGSLHVDRVDVNSVVF